MAVEIKTGLIVPEHPHLLDNIPLTPHLNVILTPEAVRRFNIANPEIQYFGEMPPLSRDNSLDLAREIVRIQNDPRSTRNLTNPLKDVQKVIDRANDPTYHVLVGGGNDVLKFTGIIQDKPDRIVFSEAFLGVVNPDLTHGGIGKEAILHMLYWAFVTDHTMEGNPHKHRRGLKLTVNIPPEMITGNPYTQSFDLPMYVLAHKMGFTEQTRDYGYIEYPEGPGVRVLFNFDITNLPTLFKRTQTANNSSPFSFKDVL